MPEKSCCLCLTLRSGTLTIGITMLVLGSVVAVSAAVILIQLFTINIPEQYSEHQGIQDIQDILFRTYEEPALIFSSQMVSGIITIIFSSLLIHGVRMGRTALVLSWLIYYGIFCGLLSLASSFFLIFALSMRWLGGLSFLAGAVASAVFWWWFAVTLKYYAEMRNGAVASAVFWWWFAVTLKYYAEMRKESGEIFRRQQSGTIVLA